MVMLGPSKIQSLDFKPLAVLDSTCIVILKVCDEDKQYKFMESVADAAGTSVGNVRILSMTESRRRAGSLDIATKILALDSAAVRAKADEN